MINFILLEKLHKFYPFLVLISLFTPTLGAIDNISIRWAALASINVFYLMINVNKGIYNNKLINLLLLLLIFSSISIGNSINLTESIISISKLVIIIITVYTLTLSFQNNPDYKEDFLKYIFLALCFELIYTIFNYMTINELYSFTGVSMNRNISSFSLLIKLPVVFYLKENKDYFLQKFIFFIVEIFMIISIFLLESRAGIAILILVYFTQIIISLRYNRSMALSYFFIFAISIFFLSSNPFKSSLLQNAEVASLDKLKSDESLLKRLEYLRVGSKIFKENPIIGSGIGTWKINSRNIDYRSDNSNDISYYAHNDFVQFLIEVGILGFLSYLLIFIIIIREIFMKWNKTKLFKYLILVFIIIFIDSIFNFPFHRPQESLLIFLFYSFIISKSSHRVHLKPISLNVLLIILSFFCLWVSSKEHTSLVDQKLLLYDYYNKEISFNENQINSINYTFPNLASNTEPISSLLANYYINNGEFKKASELVLYGIKSNPFSEYAITQEIIVLLNSGDFEEALRISKNLFEKNANNYDYADTYFSILELIGSENLFISSYSKLKISNESIHELYFTKYFLVPNYSKGSAKILLENSIQLYPNNQLLNSIYSKVLE